MSVITRAALAALISLLVLHGCSVKPRYSGPPRAHFDGQRFYNTVPAEKSLFDILRLMSTYPFRREAWPRRVDNGEWPVLPVPDGGFKLTFINHSTVLVQTPTLNFLTDPIWSERASPFTFIGPRRVRDAGIPLAALPPIDVILISHDHYDHLDIPSLKALMSHGRDGPPLVVVGLGNAGLLREHGIDHVRELDWWEGMQHADSEIIFAEVRHRSGRGLRDQMMTLWGGFVVRTPVGQMYFAGDTGYGPHFAQARARLGAFDLCLLPIGAYRPRSFMAPVHLDPAQAVQAHQVLGCRHSIAVHHGTFQLTYEGLDEPYRELAASLARSGVAADAFQVPGFGESLQVAGRAATTGTTTATTSAPASAH